MYVTYTRIYGWSDYGGESSYQPGYRLENMMWMTLLVYDYIIPGEYHDILGLCKVAYTTNDAQYDDKDGISIEEKGWSLTPGAYVGVAPVEDDGVDFEERMTEIHRELLALQAESNNLMNTISQNMKEMLGDGIE